MQKNYTELVERFNKGESHAYEELYKSYREPALRFCYSILKDIEESENIIHDVFLKIWNKKTFIDPHLNFNSYLFTIIKHQAFDYYKWMKKNESLKDELWKRTSGSEKIHNEIKEERIEKLMEAVENLSERRKEIVKLKYEEKMSYGEIARHLNISINTVKNQLVISKQIIREKLVLVRV